MLAIVLAMLCLGTAPAHAAERPAIAMPDSALADEVLSIAVTGLRPGSTVTVGARMTDDLGRPWTSAADFIADPQGRVHLDQDAPLPGGSYTGVEPMGLFYSMALVGAGQRTEFGFTKFSAASTRFTFTASVDGATVVEREFEQRFMGAGVRELPVDVPGVRGTLYLPSGQRPHPVLITLSGSDGGAGVQNLARSALFASRGYAALNLPYFGAPGLPPTQDSIPLEHFKAALDWLRSPEMAQAIDGDRIGITGGSRGGEASLLVAATYPEVKVAVASAPTGIIWPGATPTTPGEIPPPAWSLGGAPLPFVDTSAATQEYADLLAAHRGTTDPFTLTDWVGPAVLGAPNLAEAEIPVERNRDAQYLVVAGDDDGMWPSVELTGIAQRRLERHGLADNITVCDYAGAGHLLLVPNLPTTYDHYYQPSPYDVYFDLGGSPAADHHANRAAWTATLAFLDTALDRGERAAGVCQGTGR